MLVAPGWVGPVFVGTGAPKVEGVATGDLSGGGERLLNGRGVVLALPGAGLCVNTALFVGPGVVGWAGVLGVKAQDGGGSTTVSAADVSAVDLSDLS